MDRFFTTFPRRNQDQKNEREIEKDKKEMRKKMDAGQFNEEKLGNSGA